MRVARDLDTLRAGSAEPRAGGRTLAFVPTMGALPRLGTVRLLDNLPVPPPGRGPAA